MNVLRIFLSIAYVHLKMLLMQYLFLRRNKLRSSMEFNSLLMEV